MHVQVLQGRETSYPDISYFKRDNCRRISKSNQVVKNPYVSVLYGPLLFALPIPEKNPNEVKKNVPFNYALDLDPSGPTNNVIVQKKTVSDAWHWQIDNAPVILKVPALEFDWEPTELQPLPADPIKKGVNTTIDLVPYGLTKFRVSMFPVSERSWKEK